MTNAAARLAWFLHTARARQAREDQQLALFLTRNAKLINHGRIDRT